MRKAGKFLIVVVVLITTAILVTPAAAQADVRSDATPWPYSVNRITDNSYYDEDPQIHNGQITWVGGGDVAMGSSDCEIYYWDGTWSGGNPVVTQLTDNAYFEAYPQIHDGQITWSARYEGGSDYEILYYNGTTTTPLTDNTDNEWYPQIHNGQIVWRGYDGADYEIFYWDGSTIYQVTDGADNNYPQIWNGQITWQSRAPYEHPEIMEAHIPEPTTTTLFILGLVGLGAKLRRRRS